jgi:glycosyltransferase involved in cell wall biosynthesis
MEKIKILCSTKDFVGVALFRTITPSLQIELAHSDEFEVTINQNVNYDDYEYLKQFNIIHSHREFGPYEKNAEFFTFCKKNGIITILDIDDNPDLHQQHPLYQQVKIDKSNLKCYDTISKCDAVTTTTDFFKNILLKHNKNVIALNNGINVEIMPQFKYNRVESDKLRMGYIGGSSHKADIELLKDMGQLLSADYDLQSKLTLSLHGYDLNGGSNHIKLNYDLLKELNERKVNIGIIINEFNKSNGNIDMIKSLPTDLREKYRFNLVETESRKIKADETVWFEYEKIFTNNYKLIRDDKYKDFLMKFNNEPYEGEENQPYRRFFTKPINSYAVHYNSIDVSIVPLVKNGLFNDCKSPLKIAEAQAKRCAMIVSDHPIYTKYIKHGVNGLVAKDNRDFYKLTKRLVNNPQMVVDLQNKLVEDTKDEFDLALITKKRVEFYKDLISKRG